jgi:hypothetical protein
LVVAVLVLAGCGLVPGGDDVSSDEASAQLEQQRTDVRELTRTLVAGASSTVEASVRDADARWEGCRSAFNETYASYRYAAQVRLDAVADDLPGALTPVATDAGLTPTEDVEPDKLRATRDGLEVSFWALPPGSQGTLLLTVQGPCVDVPKADRDAWRDRREESPDPLA